MVQSQTRNPDAGEAVARPTWGDSALSFGLAMLAPLFLVASAAHWALSRKLRRATA